MSFTTGCAIEVFAEAVRFPRAELRDELPWRRVVPLAVHGDDAFRAAAVLPVVFDFGREEATGDTPALHGTVSAIASVTGVHARFASS